MKYLIIYIYLFALCQLNIPNKNSLYFNQLLKQHNYKKTIGLGKRKFLKNKSLQNNKYINMKVVYKIINLECSFKKERQRSSGSYEKTC